MKLISRIRDLQRTIDMTTEDGCDNAFISSTVQELEWLKELFEYKANEQKCETCKNYCVCCEGLCEDCKCNNCDCEDNGFNKSNYEKIKI